MVPDFHIRVGFKVFKTFSLLSSDPLAPNAKRALERERVELPNGTLVPSFPSLRRLAEPPPSAAARPPQVLVKHPISLFFRLCNSVHTHTHTHMYAYTLCFVQYSLVGIFSLQDSFKFHGLRTHINLEEEKIVDKGTGYTKSCAQRKPMAN